MVTTLLSKQDHTLKMYKPAKRWWLRSVIPVTQEAEAKRMEVQSQP
jgi:hypothetical protein